MDRRIPLEEVLSRMQKSNVKGSKTPFHISFISWDDKRNDGGEKKTIKRAVIMAADDAEYEAPSAGTGKHKHANHFEHSTRNLINMDDPTKHPVKVHIRLIVQFNHLYVYW